MKICDFLLVYPYCRLLRQFGWLELVIYFHTNEQDGEQNALMLNFSDNSDYDEVLRQVCATFGIKTFQEEQQKAIDKFFEGNDVSVSLPTGCEKSLISSKRQ